ncbi:MAG: hypothetical protein P8P74_07985 [Crocinitomicaceae bacterium]|nr:hypothetical protein [Crocinitomicaceae bacterium]
MKSIYLPLVLMLIFFCHACKKKSVNCGMECEYNEELIFQSGFENCSVEPIDDAYDKITGTDPNLSGANNWDVLNDHSNIGKFRINYEDGDDTQRYCEIINDPLDPTNQVLQFKIIEPHISEGDSKKGRVNAFVSRNNCLKELHQTVRIFLDPDMEYLKQWEKAISWLTLFEYWNNSTVYKEKKQFKVSVNLVKLETGIVDNLYFQVKSNRYKLTKTEEVWKETATNFPVNFSEWMTVELYIKEGDEENGRFYLAVTPDSGSKVVLFDITNTTQHPKEKCPDGFSEFNPMKLYTSDNLINFMKDNGKSLEVLWDDWKLYKNKTP